MKALAGFIVGAFFALSAVAKLSSMESFELYIFSFEAASFDLSSIAARLIVIFELTVGTLLMFNIFSRPVKWATGISLAGFSLFLIWRMAEGDNESCHCMGELIDMNPTQSLIKNAAAGLLLAYSWKARTSTIRKQGLIAGITMAATATLTFAITPPDFYFRNSSVSNDLSPQAFSTIADSLGLSSGKYAICFYSGSCEHCRHCASKMASLIRRNSIDEEMVKVIFMQTHTNQDSVATAFYNESGEGLHLPYTYLHPLEFLLLTNGSMPLVVLYEDGALVKEYDYIGLDEKEISSFLN